jgi:hypothetical protein
MTVEPEGFPKVLTLYLELSQYPILASQIRERMRQELFRRGVITPEAFEAEARQKAIQSQEREGLADPLVEEPPDTWLSRLGIVRDNLTDFYFAYNLPHDLFADLVRDTLAKRLPSDEIVLTFHPELAPWDMLFAQGEAFEAMPASARADVEHHLEEIKVVLIKAMISDHLEYVGIAKEWLSIKDLKEIRAKRIGRGKIGGKAAGIELARCILRQSAPEELQAQLRFPRSWFLAADVFYQFLQFNSLLDHANQKYRSEREIREDYPRIQERFQDGWFSEDIVEQLRHVLEELGPLPVIVRSSSLLEDSFGFSFAGKYQSYFCPNQGTPKENLRQLLQAIARVYASVYSPDALLYRRSKGLLDYDERMAALIQEVPGRRVGDFYLPDAAGVSFSRNQYRWSPAIDRRAGFARLVWGLGTRAVEQLSNDYPRLVALSHPDLRPEADPARIRRYSQHFVDLIDLQANQLRTLPVSQALSLATPRLRWIVQRYEQGHLADFVSAPLQLDPQEIVITFDGLLRRSSFPKRLAGLLQLLEAAYRRPVDMEFLAMLPEAGTGFLDPLIYLLQCRPQSRLERAHVELPRDVPPERRLFVSHRLIPDGRVSGIRYLVYIAPERYRQGLEEAARHALARLIGRLNSRLAEQGYLLMGPGRWGSQNPGIGIPVGYGDIYHARALVEIADEKGASEPSYGTHFFQDLVEAGIYPLALALEDPEDEFNAALLEQAPNLLGQLLPDDATWEGLVRVVDIGQVSPGDLIELVMNGEAEMAIAYLRPAEA